MQTELPEWLRNLIIFGRENDEEDEGNEDDEHDEGDEEDGEEGEGGKEGEESEEDSEQKKRADALEASLKKERKLRRAAERDARKASKAKNNSQEEKDSAALQKQLEDQEKKTQKLATGYRNSAVDNAILEAAREAGFIDPTDALLDSVRKEVDVDQDEEDPSDLDIDEDSVTDAVQKLAKKKKHLIGKPGGGEKSGGKFGRKKTEDGKIDEATLPTLYPSLR